MKRRATYEDLMQVPDRLETDRWIVAATYGGNDVIRAEPFDAIEIALERWWLESADPTRRD